MPNQALEVDPSVLAAYLKDRDTQTNGDDDCLIVDCRNLEDYNNSHVKSAINAFYSKSMRSRVLDSKSSSDFIQTHLSHGTEDPLKCEKLDLVLYAGDEGTVLGNHCNGLGPAAICKAAPQISTTELAPLEAAKENNNQMEVNSGAITSSSEKFTRVLFDKLKKSTDLKFKRIMMLKGGFRDFRQQYPELCENNELASPATPIAMPPHQDVHSATASFSAAAMNKQLFDDERSLSSSSSSLTYTPYLDRPSLLKSFSKPCLASLGSPSAESDSPTEGHDYMFLGSQHDGLDIPTLKHNGITKTFDLSENCPRPESIDNDERHFPIFQLDLEYDDSYGAPIQPDFERGFEFSDFYRMGSDNLGAGAYASVRTATSISTGKEYAVKLVSKHEPGHTRSRILREVETFKMCKNHPNIVQLIEWFEDDNYFYMVFEKVRGGPLLNHIQRKVCFTEQEASMVTKDIATALKYLHDRGIAHRDIKPENILCMDPDRVSPVKLCDLDLASKPHVTKKNSRPLPKVISEPDLASPVGSAEFMAPEVVDAFVGDALKYDKRCDMWSLGVIIYIMLCGYPPFYGECDRENCGWDQGEQCTDCQESLFHRIQRGDFYFPEEEWSSISHEAKDLISHLLVKNVRQRYTADDVLKHPWVVHGAPKTPLLTADNLFRNDSARDLHQMQEHFNVMNRFNGNTHEEAAPTVLISA